MQTSFYTREELPSIGLKSYGENVLISKYARFYSPEEISIGNNVRIDDFCLLSGKINIGNYVHLSSSAVLTAGVAGIDIEDFANLSLRVNIFANSDDYSGMSMTNAMVPEKYKKLVQKKVIIRRHVIIGCASVVLPGVTLSEGTAIGAMSLVNKDTEAWTIYAGIPAKKIRPRSKDILSIEHQMLRDIGAID